MAPDVPPGMGGFFGGMLGDLLRMLKTDAPIQWELAVQLTEVVAAGDGGSSNVDPVDRIRLEEFGRLAELHVADVTGMSTTPSGRPAIIKPVNTSEWARQSLEQWRPTFEALAASLAPRIAAGEEHVVDEDDRDDDEQAGDIGAFLNQWAGAIAPAMMGMQIGSIVGHLAKRSLGQYDLLLARTDPDTILVIAENGKRFATDWSLPLDDVALYLAVRDLTRHSLLSRTHVRTKLNELIAHHADSFRPDPHALESLFGDASPGEFGDLNSLAQVLGDPAALGSRTDSPEARQAAAELDTLVAAIIGYSEYVLDTVASRVVSTRVSIREALRRARIEQSEEEASVEALLGLRLNQETFERGGAFVNGVLERGGEADLATMFVREDRLPTPAELVAPGLWLERIHLPDLGERSTGPDRDESDSDEPASDEPASDEPASDESENDGQSD